MANRLSTALGNLVVRIHPRRHRTPPVLQMEAVECGAASLAMILGYFGRFEPLEKLRVACGVSRDGSKASNLLKAARSYGLLAKGYKKETEGLRSMPLPMVLFWNFNHYLILEDFGHNKVYLNDPALGPRTVDFETFDQSYTGVALAFEAGPEFQRGGSKPNLLRSLATRLPGMKLGLLLLLLPTLGLVLPGLLTPSYSRIFFDKILGEMQHHWVRPLLLAMLLTAVVNGLFTWLQQRAFLQLQGRLSLSGSSKFFWHILRLPAEFFSQRYVGDVSARVEINDRIATLLCSDLATNVVNALTIVFYAALLFQYDAVLTWLGIALAAVNLLVLRLLGNKRKESNRMLMKERGKLLGVSMAGLQMIETYKATGAESDFFAKWAGYQTSVLNAAQKIGTASLILMAVPGLLLAMNGAAILWLGGLRVMDGILTMGMLIAFQSLMTLFLDPVGQLVELGGKLQEADADMSRVDDVLRYAPQRESGPEPAEAPPRLNGSLELRGVTFGYSRLDAPLIEDLNLTLRPGQRIALVGGSGSGKSTIAKLVCGLYQPWEGDILFDGVPRNDIHPAALARSLASVDQDIVLFEGSIRSNLSLWDDTVDEEIIVQAAKDACIHDDITARPGGYDAVVEEQGRNFSGGQRQRLEIARSLAGEPRILVLDEATSALDPQTEKYIDDALRARACTCLIVAHRLSTIRDCDEIVVLERGRVVERGTHDDLLTANGVYMRLIHAV